MDAIVLAQGMPTIFFGGVLFIMASVLLYRSVAAKGYRIGINRNHWKRLVESVTARRFGGCIGLVGLYFALLGIVNFVALTAAFLFCNIAYFKGARWWINLIISFSASLSVWLVFYKVFLVPLP